MNTQQVIETLKYEGHMSRAKMAEVLGWSRQRFYASEYDYDSLRFSQIKALADRCGFTVAIYDKDGMLIDYPFIPDVRFGQFCQIVEGCNCSIKILDKLGNELKAHKGEDNVSGYKAGQWVSTDSAVVAKKIGGDDNKILYRMWNGRYFIVRSQDGKPVIDRVVTEEEAKSIIE